MTRECVVRAATKADLNAIAIISRSARKLAMPWLPDIHTSEDDIWYFSNSVLPNETLLVSCEGAEILGFASYADGWLNHLYVTPMHWRRGVGTKLLATVLAANSALQLWTFQQNHNARQFYLAHGFVECERTDGQGNEERMPDIRMEFQVRI